MRILDASDLGDDHAVIYDCEKIRHDGTCDPQFTFVDVIARKMTPLPEENRVHLRNVIRKACLEPGDFADADHNGMSNTRITRYFIFGAAVSLCNLI